MRFRSSERCIQQLKGAAVRISVGYLTMSIRRKPQRARCLFSVPTAIFDHAGHHVYSDAGWNQAAHRFPTLKREAAKLALDGSREFVLEDWVLRAQRLTPDFSLAPNGAMLVLERAEVAMLSNNAGASPDVFLQVHATRAGSAPTCVRGLEEQRHIGQTWDWNWFC